MSDKIEWARELARDAEAKEAQAQHMRAWVQDQGITEEDAMICLEFCQYFNSLTSDQRKFSLQFCLELIRIQEESTDG